jgi:ElaB/YqjD/DUF883 family membrane-anchored ribosome-binding protein
MRATGHRLKNDLSDGVNDVKTAATVRDSPWQAVGVAALVGAVVGILATRRS